MAPTHSQREFFAVRTLDEALTGFRPSRRMGAERIGLGEAFGRVPAEPLVAPHALPGFARATVDGYAVRVRPGRPSGALALSRRWEAPVVARWRCPRV